MNSKLIIQDIMKNKFVQGYIECLLWSSTDENNDSMDSKYSIDDFSEGALSQINKDCETFIKRAGALLDSIDAGLAGHDFWLTRNGHGCGFWSRGTGFTGDRLTKISKSFCSLDPYVGDDGKLYL